MLDIACADGLNTEFYSPPVNVRVDYLKEMISFDAVPIFGVSDGGAHTKFFTGGRYSTEALIKIGRDNNLMSLEDLHWRLARIRRCVPVSRTAAPWSRALGRTSLCTTSTSWRSIRWRSCMTSLA